MREREQQIRIQREQEAAQKKNAEAALLQHNATFEKIRKLETIRARGQCGRARSGDGGHRRVLQAGHFGAGCCTQQRRRGCVHHWSTSVSASSPLSYLQEIGDRSLMQAAGAAVNAITAANAVTADGPVASAWEAPVSFGEWEPAVHVMEAAINAVPQCRAFGPTLRSRRQPAEATTDAPEQCSRHGERAHRCSFGQNTNALVAILSKSQQSHRRSS